MYSMCVKSSVKQTGGEASPKKARHQGGNDNQEHGGTAMVRYMLQIHAYKERPRRNQQL